MECCNNEGTEKELQNRLSECNWRTGKASRRRWLLSWALETKKTFSRWTCLNLSFLNCSTGIIIASPGWGSKNYMKFTYSSHKYLWSIYHMPGTILGTCSVASVMSDSVTPWTVAHQAPLSMGFPSKNTGVGYHFLLRGIFLPQGLNLLLLELLHWQADSLSFEPPHGGISVNKAVKEPCPTYH